MSIQGRERLFLTFVLFCLGAGWGLTQPLTKIAVSTGHQPFGLLFWQLAIGTVLLGSVTYLRGQVLPVHASALRVYVIIAVVGTLLPNSFSYRAAAHLPSGIMSIIIATVPMFAFPIALALGIDRFSRRRLVGLALGLSGVALIALPATSLPDPAMLLWLPVALVAPLCYGIEGNVVSRWGIGGLDPVQALFGASLLGMLVMLPAAVMFGQFIDPRAGMGGPEWALVGSSLIHGLIYALYVWLVGRAGAVFASQVAYMVTGCGVVWAIIILSETYSVWVWAAMAVMLLGISLVQPRMGGNPVALAPEGPTGETRAKHHAGSR